MSVFRKRKTAWVGVGLHHQHISLIKMQCVNQTYSIENFLLTPLPLHFISDGKILEPVQIGNLIKSMVQSCKAHHCRAVISFPFAHVINKRIRLASFLKEEERHTEIANHMNDYFPGIHDELNFDCVQASDSQAEDDLLLVAARTREIDAFVSVVTAARLQVCVVDVDMYALVRAVNFIYGISDEKIVLLDATLSQFIVLQQGKILFSHVMIFDSVENALQTIRKALQFFAPGDSVITLKKILFSGQWAFWSSLKHMLEDLLQITIQEVNPFVSDQFVTKQDKALLQKEINISLMTLGLGLRGCNAGS